MRKLVVFLAFAVLCSGTIVAEKGMSFGAGLVSNSILLAGNGNEITIKTSGVGFTLDTFNRLGQFPVTFFTGLSASLPKSIDYEFSTGTTTMDELDLSYTLDTLLGLGYMIGANGPFSILIGGGVGASLMNINKVDYTLASISMGVGVNVTACYKFTPNIGLSVVLRDNYNPKCFFINEGIYDLTDTFKSGNSLTVAGALQFIY